MNLLKVLHDIHTTLYRQMRHYNMCSKLHHGWALVRGSSANPIVATHKQDERLWCGIGQSRREWYTS